MPDAAPAARMPDLLRPRGSNQVGMRQFNERTVLQALRVHGSLPKAELARLTGLSAQTIGLIDRPANQQADRHDVGTHPLLTRIEDRAKT